MASETTTSATEASVAQTGFAQAGQDFLLHHEEAVAAAVEEAWRTAWQPIITRADQDGLVDVHTINHFRVAWRQELKKISPLVDELYKVGAISAMQKAKALPTGDDPLWSALKTLTADAGDDDDLSDLLDTGVASQPAVLAFDIIDKRAVDYISNAENRMEDVGEYAWQQARSTLAAGIASGESVEKLKERLVAVLNESEKRATLIARTEVHQAAVQGSIDGMRALGDNALQFKTWSAVLDDRTREEHADADGTTIPLEDTFDVDYAGQDAPDAPNCRCVITYGNDPDGSGSVADADGSWEDDPDNPDGPMIWVPADALEASAQAQEDNVRVKTKMTGAGAGSPRRVAAVGRQVARQLQNNAVTAAGPTPDDEVAPPDDAAPADGEDAPTPTATAPAGAPAFEDGETWRALMCTEGIETGDGRMIQSGATQFRDLPLPLMWQPANQIEHDGAVFVGQITRVQQAGADWWGFGTIDAGGEAGAEFTRILTDNNRFGVSVDMDSVDVEYVFPDTDIPDDDGLVNVEDLDELLWDQPAISLFVDCRIMGLTATPFPAFPNAYIELNPALLATPDLPEGSGAPAPAPAPQTTPAASATVADVLIASAIPVDPPASWFEDPVLQGPTAMTISSEGRVYGHLALWGTCHTGFQGTCITPPSSQRGYSDFHLGACRTAEGYDLAVGHITIGTGHAGKLLGAMAAAAHYDNTGTQAALIRCGEDAHGIWFAGALDPAMTPENIRTLRSAPLSGDWRERGGSLELIASLAVNVPGFPVPRVGAGVDAEHQRQLSLVAAGVVVPASIAAQATRRTRALATEALDNRLGRTQEDRLARLDLIRAGSY